jgi:hypothetical protein
MVIVSVQSYGIDLNKHRRQMMPAQRFFKTTPDLHNGYSTALMCDNGDILPLDVLRNSREIYRDETKVIVHALISDRLMADIVDLAEVENPLSPEAVQALGIVNAYCGEEYSSEPYKGLFWYFPDLAGQRVGGQDEDGNDIMVDKVLRHTWF